MSWFDDYAARKTREARAARISPLHTLDDRSDAFPVDPVQSAWTREYYDGPFHVWRIPRDLPAVSLVFVQSRDGNTVAGDPADLGGGDTDKHLIYEGLSRVTADAVMAGATTAEGEVFFSVWHPEIVELRLALGLPRHPAQIVLTARGCIDVERTLLFNTPDVPVFVLGTAHACSELSTGLGKRPWVTVLKMEALNLAEVMGALRSEHRLRRISAVGGRTTATALVDAGLVQDLYLTITETSAGEPGTPWYAGKRPLAFQPVVRKRCTIAGGRFVFEHQALADRA